ncbi:MAG: class I SAM-dependent RNA methyltransferase [Clostridiaceae bacterium]|nr:class I SAM-dependent RNA methyltransferase [Clostridiaceae bacterium]
MKIVITTLFGIEALTADELIGLGYNRNQFAVTDGQIVLDAGEPAAAAALAVARLNVFLSTAERVLLQLAEFPAADFETLFDSTSRLPWEEWIPSGYAFHINGYSRKSKLFGISACQSLIKKAIVSRLLKARHLPADGQLPEDMGIGLVRVQFSLVADIATLMVDTSGDGLHKRGYRPLQHEAPIKETLAAALLRLSHFKPFSDEALLDPMCGSGTIPIEAALLAARIAPGMNRPFAGEQWPFIGGAAFSLARDEALSLMTRQAPEHPFIFGSDLSPEAVEIARLNAHRAGVADWIRFRQANVLNIKAADLPELTGFPRHLIICNPPYGERMLDPKQAEQLLSDFSHIYLEKGQARPDIRLSVITPNESYERLAGGQADKRRKLYNGMIKCTLYHYYRQRRLHS